MIYVSYVVEELEQTTHVILLEYLDQNGKKIFVDSVTEVVLGFVTSWRQFGNAIL